MLKDFEFQVNLVAVVRVRAADESVAREVVPTALGAPGSAELRLANQTILRWDASITSVDLYRTN
jgi:hypothetical protein